MLRALIEPRVRKASLQNQPMALHEALVLTLLVLSRRVQSELCQSSLSGRCKPANFSVGVTHPR